MPFARENSIRLRLATTLLLAFVALLGLASTSIYFISKKILEQDFDARLFAKAQAATASISQKGVDLDVDWSELPHEPNPRKHAQDFIQLIDSGGRAFFQDSPVIISSSLPLDTENYQDVDLPEMGHFRVLTLGFLPRVEEEDASVTPSSLRKPCVLTVAGNRSSLDHSLSKLAVILTLMTGGTALISVALVWFILKRALRPLDELSLAVSKIKAESLGQSIILNDLPKELTPIVEKLNGLMNRLEVSFAREKRFSADISHELRTPVAELKTLSEVMLQETTLAPEVHRAFQDTRDIAVQMELLVTVLLEMVRQEEGAVPLVLSEIDLELQIEATWKRYEERAVSKQLRFKISSPAKTIWVRTEPRLLSMALSNLFDNAVEYSPVGSEIQVEVQEEKASPTLIISNPAAKLVPADLPHLFERFWRKDKARGPSGHFGIGLALTQTLCQRIGVRLTASMDDEGRISFSLPFPNPAPTGKK